MLNLELLHQLVLLQFHKYNPSFWLVQYYIFFHLKPDR